MFELTTDAGTGTSLVDADQAVFAAREYAKKGLRLEISIPGRPGYILVQYGQCGVVTLGHPSQRNPVDMEVLAASIRSGI